MMHHSKCSQCTLSKAHENLKMGDDVEIEEIFDADLLSGSEDEEEAAHQEEALLGVDAVRPGQIHIFYNFQCPGLCKSLW